MAGPAGRKPRIAILTNYPYDGASFTGGVETATAGLLEGLTKYSEEFDFHIIALSKDIPTDRTEVRDGMIFQFIAVPTAWFVRPRIIPNVVRAVAKLKKLQPDLVHCQDNMALAIGAIITHHPRMLFTVHGIKSVEAQVWKGPEYWSHKLDALLERLVRQRFNEVITISPYVDGFLPPHVKTHHIANPVRSMFFENPQTGNGSKQILFVGVLTRLKRPLDVLRAFAIVQRKHADARLSLVGLPEDPAYHQEMLEFIRCQNLRGVEFAPKKSQREVAALMRSASVLVLASVQENTPMVIAEAMASGLPVIASRVGGIPMMIDHGATGLLFECGDIEQLSATIINVVENSDLRQRLSQAGRVHARATYSADAVAEATVKLYRATLDRK